MSLAEDFADGDDVTVIPGNDVIFDDVSSYVRSFSGRAMAFFKRARNPRRFGVPALEGESRWPWRRSRLIPKATKHRSASTRRISRRELKVVTSGTLGLKRRT